MSGVPDRVLMAFDLLEPFPGHVLDAMHLLDDLSSSAEQVAQAIGRDPVLAARVFTTAAETTGPA